ncbi:hypothetical protein GCM10010519_36810 [Streptomyces lactacystinicus]
MCAPGLAGAPGLWVVWESGVTVRTAAGGFGGIGGRWPADRQYRIAIAEKVAPTPAAAIR